MSLPTGYTEVQYIQSSGTQYVDSEVVPNDTTRVVMDFQLISPGSGNQCLFGVVGQFSFRWYGSGSVFRSNGGNNVDFPNSIAADVRHSVDKNTTKTTLDLSISVTTTAGSCTLALYIMAQHASSGASNYSSAKCYSCQIYDNSTLIRDYIPCINPDGEAGFYDTVNSKFYGNAGTGVFFAGPSKVSLPSTYTQLEYILSSSTQLIDTGIAPGNTTKVEIDFEPTALTSNHLMILGTRNSSSGGNQFVIGWTGHKSPAVWRSDYYSSQVDFTTAITGVARHYAVKDGASCKIDTETVTNTAATFTSSYTLYLFGGNQAGTAVSQITAKLYRCKIYTSDQLVRDLVPCMNAAGAIGLYDLVNSKFYANAGTGVFTAGPEVIWPSNDAIYVKVNGIWRQIDGIKLL